MYQATICKLTNIQKHPNADRLNIALAAGYNVIVGLDVNEDTLGIVFPSDGRLTAEMLLANKLYRKHPLTGELLGGYFEENGRVKSLKLRGALSEAFWTPLTALSFAGDTSSLEKKFNKGELVQLDTFNGVKLCEKYFTQATLKQMSGQGQKAAKKVYAVGFEKHGDTSQLRDTVSFLVGQDLFAVVTEKCHGTSGRTGLVRWTKPSGLWQKLLSKLNLYRGKYRYVTGTRNVVLDPDKMNEPETGFYAGTNFRASVHNMIASKGLREDEVLYYEIVGFDNNGSPIMAEHGLDKKSLKETGIPEKELSQYGDKMTHSYGCGPKEHAVYVYRIVQNGRDLTWTEMVHRCKQLGLNAVPYLDSIIITPEDTVETIMSEVEKLTRGNSVLDDSHIKEGVCLRFDSATGLKVYKYKGFMFCALEGIRKNSEDYVDFEEVS